VASLLLARGAAHQREMAVRVSLGASRSRLMRQVLTESLLLSAAGSLPAVFLAYFGAEALLRILESGRQMPGFPLHLDIPLQPDGHVLLFSAGVALLTGVLFGLAPAWNAFASPLRLRCSKSGGLARPGSRSVSERAWWWRRWLSRWCC
jgi:ABC-type antimicrobial peptide transport system permease subunit